MSPHDNATRIIIHSALLLFMCALAPLCVNADDRCENCDDVPHYEIIPAQLPNAGESHRQGAEALAAGDIERALELLESATASTGRNELPLVLNDLGRAYSAIDRPYYAIAAFADAQRLTDSNDSVMLATATANLARVLLATGDVDATARTLPDFRSAIEDIDEPTARARFALMLGTLLRDSQVELAGPAAWRRDAFDAFDDALRYAQRAGSTLLESSARGQIGRLYEDERRWDAALRYTRRAALLAQRAGNDELLYEWHWQSARILRAKGEIGQALLSYGNATESLAKVRLSVVSRSPASFENDVAPLYFEFADLLLATTPALSSSRARQERLRMATDALEQLKVAEIEDYFEDECAINEDPAEIERLTSSAAILYPIVLPDRIELLLNVSNELTQHTVPIDQETFDRFVTGLRRALEDPASGTAYRAYAEAIYDWTIRPIEPQIDRSGIHTIVVVPGGSLRTIPIGVLHDGERFLVERFAVATSPGLTLTGGRSARSGAETYVQINGLTEATRGFPSLPHVRDEIASISQMFASDVNRDADFLATTIETDLAAGPFDIVHIATHGQFHSDRRRSFLLTHDELITMERLEVILGNRRYASEPIELLFLSACQTATGDDRAALGLAGVAVRTGAESVVASLWLINDESTARLVSTFYRALSAGDVTKAEALRGAQLELLGDSRYAHPNYWAPFLLVGNWL